MILRDLNHWKGILSRLKFQSLTYDKRNVVLGNLNNYFKELKQIYETKQQNGNDFLNDDDAEEKTNDKNIIGLSSKISLIISAHSLKQKCANAIKLSTVLNDLKDYNTFHKNALTLQKNIEQYIEENIADWNGMFIGLSQELPKLGEDIVEIDKNSGFLKVNFSEKLFQLIQDVRILTEYGYYNKIDRELMSVNNEGKKILKDAISLKQIANFYNTLSSQVIPSQKPMLVKCAKEFEMNLSIATKKFKSNTNKIDLENYVNIIQTAANSLTTEIRRLKKAHAAILDLLCQLFNYDLISNKFKWKEILQKAKDIYDDIADNYKEDKSLLNEWKSHWNFQLYKILKIQYTISLDKFYSFVTEVPCEFAIQHRALALNPPLEDIKKQIYRDIEKFLSIPSTIRNFISDEDDQSYYHTIVEENSKEIQNLYSKLNNSVIKLTELKKNLADDVGLSYLDFESYVNKNFISTED